MEGLWKAQAPQNTCKIRFGRAALVKGESLASTEILKGAVTFRFKACLILLSLLHLNGTDKGSGGHVRSSCLSINFSACLLSVSSSCLSLAPRMIKISIICIFISKWLTVSKVYL